MSFGSTPQVNYTPSGITSQTGLNVNNRGGYSESPTLSGNVSALANQYGQAAQATSNLAQTVAPGYSQARQAGMQTLESNYASALSNLQGNLSQRRILGSSFGDAAVSNLEAQKAQDEANFQANSYFQETAQYNQLMQEQYQYSTAQYQTYVQQANIEAGLAGQLTQSNNQIAAQIATSNAQLQAQSQAGTGALLGVGASIALAPFTGGASLLAAPGLLAGSTGGNAVNSTPMSFGQTSNTPGIFSNSSAFGPGGMFGSGSQFMGGGNWMLPNQV